MINYEDIKNLAAENGVSEHIIEKNYVIGWVLWGIGQDPVLRDKWIFKGGTCIKKCYRETHRFSEDLDFTIVKDGPYKSADVQPILTRIIERVHDESGINFSAKPILLKESRFPYYTEGRIYYQGPRNLPNPPMIKLDLMASEKVIQPAVARKIVHGYADDLPGAAEATCYSLEEIFAEKIRAMGERGLPRDLYDIIFLFREGVFKQHHKLIKMILAAKCDSKGVPIPDYESIGKSPFIDELKSEWANMLAHQLPALPPFEEYWADLPKLFNWLDGKYEPEKLPDIPALSSGESAWRPTPVNWQMWRGQPLELIRFAAINHICIDLGYKGTRRLIEPYSLRQSKAGDILLYAIKHSTREPRAYRVDRIEGVRITSTTFNPIYHIEFPQIGVIYAPQIERKASFGSRKPKRRRR